MEAFVKPGKVFVDVKGYLETLLPSGLEKDLHDNEEICEVCHGTGFAKDDHRYGLEGDPNRSPFPYKHESLWWCPACYNGVVRRCEYCGKLIPKGRLVCDCETVRQMKKKEEDKAASEALNKAEELDSDALGTKFGMCYSDHITHNEGYFNDWDDFFEAWDDKDEDLPRPQYVWGTREVEIHIDAYRVLENATEEMYEDAYDDIGKKAFDELQSFLNDWCTRCGVGKSYEESHKFKVRIPWEVYDARGQEDV